LSVAEVPTQTLSNHSIRVREEKKKTRRSATPPAGARKEEGSPPILVLYFFITGCGHKGRAGSVSTSCLREKGWTQPLSLGCSPMKKGRKTNTLLKTLPAAGRKKGCVPNQHASHGDSSLDLQEGRRYERWALPQTAGPGGKKGEKKKGQDGSRRHSSV